MVKLCNGKLQFGITVLECKSKDKKKRKKERKAYGFIWRVEKYDSIY